MTTRPRAARGTQSGPSLWAFGPEDRPVTVRNAEALLAHLPVFIGGWPLRRVGPAGGIAPDIDVIEGEDGAVTVLVGGPGGNEMAFDDAFQAANGLAGGLVARFVAARDDLVCLHAGSALVGNGLVAVLGDSFAGKSSVSLHLAAAGYRLFGDDRLAVAYHGDGPARGLCLGLMPKVRLPLPDDCGTRFAEFVDGYTEIRDDNAAYLKLWEGEAATFGEEAPLTAIVMLERGDTEPTRIEPGGRAETVRALLVNCFAPHIDATRLVGRLGALAAGCACHRVAFSSSQDAAAAIARTLRDG